MHIRRTSEGSPLAPAAGTVSSESEPRGPLGQGRPAPGTDDSSGAPGSTSAPSPFLALLRGLGRELDRGETIAETAIRGAGSHGSMSPARLIALQAGIYRYSEAVDLLTKVVDRGTQAVRTTLQNQ